MIGIPWILVKPTKKIAITAKIDVSQLRSFLYTLLIVM